MICDYRESKARLHIWANNKYRLTAFTISLKTCCNTLQLESQLNSSLNINLLQKDFIVGNNNQGTLVLIDRPS